MIKLNERVTFNTIVPYSSQITEEIIKTNNNDFVSSWQLSGISLECESELNFDIFNEQTHAFLKSFSSENLTFYVHIIREKLQDSFNTYSDNYFADKISNLYYQGISAESFMINKIYFTLVFSPCSKIVNARIKKLNIKEQREVIESHLKNMREYCENITAFFTRFSGKRLKTFTNDKGVMFSEQLAFYNFLISGSWQKVPVKSTPIYNILGFADVYFSNENGELHILGKKKFFRSIEIKELPERSNSNILDSLLISDCEFVLTQSFSCLPKRNSLSAIKIAEKRMQASSDDAYGQINDLSEAKNELAGGDIFFGNYHFSLFVYNDSLDGVIKNSNKILAILSDVGFVPIFSTHSLVAAFCSQLPAVFDLRPRLLLLSSKNFVDFASFHNFETGKRDKNCWGEAIAILKTPNRQPYYLNLHDSNIKKNEFGEKNLANTSVIGTSGSGKTMLLSFLLNMFQKYDNANSFSENAKSKKLTTIFLDKDQGAEVNIKALGGEYYTFKHGKPTGWNPFMLVANSENIAFLKDLIKLLCTRSGETLTARELTAISDSVDSVMSLDKDKRIYGVSRCIDNLNKSINKNEKANDLVMRLKRWSRDGEFGWVFDNKIDNFNIEHCRNFGIDGTEFLENKDICPPVSFYILHRVKQLFDGRRGIIFIDEFWRWIMDKIFAGSTYDWFKTIRKLNALVIVATQSPDEILKHDIAKAVIEICATQIFLANPRANKKDYVDGFKVTEEEYEIIKNLDPAARQFLIKKNSLQGDSKPFSAVVTLDLKNLGSYTKILSTNRDNLAIFHDIYKENMQVEDWLEDYVRLAI